MAKISILTAVYNEEDTVRRCYEEVKRVFEGMGGQHTYEHLFGDNRSTDRTLSILREIATEDPNVKVLAYSRNFGAEKSAFTLLRYASGDAIIGIAADLQEPPELFPMMLDLWSQGNELVLGLCRNTSDTWIMQRIKRAYYRLAARLSNEELERNFSNYSLLDRQVADEMLKVDDFSPYIRGLISTVGFTKAYFTYERRPRVGGESKHRFSFLLDFGLNAVISYSILPIRLATILGIALSCLSLLLAFAYAMLKIFKWNFQAPGATTTIVLILFFSGIQLFFLGMLGEYIGAIHSQVRRKPFVIVREKINFGD